MVLLWWCNKLSVAKKRLKEHQSQVSARGKRWKVSEKSFSLRTSNWKSFLAHCGSSVWGQSMELCRGEEGEQKWPTARLAIACIPASIEWTINFRSGGGRGGGGGGMRSKEARMFLRLDDC